MKKYCSSLFAVLFTFHFAYNQSNFSKTSVKVDELSIINMPIITHLTEEGNTLMLTLRPHTPLTKATQIQLAVFDDAMKSIKTVKYSANPEIIKIRGQLQGKLNNFSNDFFKLVETKDDIFLIYERTIDFVPIKISKKDWSFRVLPEVTIEDAKTPITIFEKFRTIIFSTVYNKKYYVLVPHKEDNLLWLYSFDSDFKLQKKTIKMPIVKRSKKGGKSEGIAFTDFKEIHNHDSLLVFNYEANELDDKLYETTILNLETQQARVTKFAYPKTDYFKEKDKTKTMSTLYEDKILMSVINDKKYTLSVRNISTGEEIHTFSFDVNKELPIANNTVRRCTTSYRDGSPDPLWYKPREISLEKFWKRMIEGGNDSDYKNTGIINIQKVNTLLRLSFGFKDHSWADVMTNNIDRTRSNRSKYHCDINFAHINIYVDPKTFKIDTRFKETPLEKMYETLMEDKTGLCYNYFNQNNKDYLVYYDKKTKELVLMTSTN